MNAELTKMFGNDPEFLNTLLERIRIVKEQRIQNQAAHVIQKACYNWLWNTTTRDGMIGINCRIGLKKCGLI